MNEKEKWRVVVGRSISRINCDKLKNIARFPVNK